MKATRTSATLSAIAWLLVSAIPAAVGSPWPPKTIESCSTRWAGVPYGHAPTTTHVTSTTSSMTVTVTVTPRSIVTAITTDSYTSDTTTTTTLPQASVRHSLSS